MAIIAGRIAALAGARLDIGPGRKNVKAIAQACADRGVECLTLFAFSTENWQRPRREVNLLLELMRGVLNDDIEELNAKGARLRFIGERGRFPKDLQELMADAERQTASNEKLQLAIAVNYGGRWDIVQAARALAAAAKDGESRQRVSTRPASLRNCRWAICRRPICASAPAATGESATSCCGISPIRSSTSRRTTGRTSTKKSWRWPSPISALASVATGGVSQPSRHRAPARGGATRGRDDRRSRFAAHSHRADFRRNHRCGLGVSAAVRVAGFLLLIALPAAYEWARLAGLATRVGRSVYAITLTALVIALWQVPRVWTPALAAVAVLWLVATVAVFRYPASIGWLRLRPRCCAWVSPWWAVLGWD